MVPMERPDHRATNSTVLHAAWIASMMLDMIIHQLAASVPNDEGRETNYGHTHNELRIVRGVSEHVEHAEIVERALGFLDPSQQLVESFGRFGETESEDAAASGGRFGLAQRLR